MGSSKARKDRRQQAQPTEGADTSKASSSGQHDIGEGDSPHSSSGALVDFERDVKCQQAGDKGRGLFWCPSNGGMLVKGTHLVELEPEMIVPCEETISEHCHVCFKEHIQCCSGCNLVGYCSTECKEYDQPIHKYECRAIQSIQPHIGAKDPNQKLRILGRLIWKRFQLGEAYASKLDDLKPHCEPQDDETIEIREMLEDYVGSGVENAHPSDHRLNLRRLGVTNPGEITTLYARIELNYFLVQCPLLKKLGAALSCVASMFNHDCDPNVVVTFPRGPGVKKGLQVVAIKDIKPGEELTTFYVDTFQPSFVRQIELGKDYHFRCNCPLCVSDTRIQAGLSDQVDPRLAVWCGRPECSGLVAYNWYACAPRGVCTLCKKACILNRGQIRWSLHKAQSFFEAFNEDVDEAKYTISHAKVFRAQRKVIECTMMDLTSFQPPSAYPLCALLHRFSKMLNGYIRFLVRTGNAHEYHPLRKELFRCLRLMLAAYQEGNNSVIREGHQLRIATCLRLLNVAMEAASPWDNQTPSTFFLRVPELPPLGKELGQELFRQAAQEMKIGYGKDYKLSTAYQTLQLKYPHLCPDA